jgi:hypothetical protein
MWIGQPTCWGLCWEPFISGALGSVELCRVNVKGFHVQGLAMKSIRVAYVDQCKNRMCHVYQVLPVGCTSTGIVVTLRYE